MTDEAVIISIRVTGHEIQIERKVKIDELEEMIQGIAVETACQTLKMGIKVLDDRMAESVPKGWQNVGTKANWIVDLFAPLPIIFTPPIRIK